jgi:hypothetical protein
LDKLNALWAAATAHAICGQLLMSGRQTWFESGIVVAKGSRPDVDVASADWRRITQGQVRLTMSSSGTEVKWAVDTPCYTSLFHIMDSLEEYTAPFVLRFHAVGWFEEVYASAEDAVRRMELIISRGDRYFKSRAFVKDGNLTDVTMPAILRESLERLAAPEEYCVECAFDENSHNYIVDRIGPKSAIGRLWGTYTSSFPCLARSRYGDAVSAAYNKVLEEGQPHYDQVLAAMRLPDNQIHWVPYHRLIFPSFRKHGLPAVSVVSEIAKVEFSVI